MDVLKREIEKKGRVQCESRRLFHGRGHCFPGYEDVLIDWFAPVALVTLYRHRPEEWLQQLVDWLKSYLSAQAVVVQERYLDQAPSRVFGQLPSEVNAVEAGLKYRLRLNDAQNIGFFLDMAIGRRLVSQAASGRKILNLFAYTCSFSVAAINAGARQVVNVDMNQGALTLGQLNHRLNALDLRSAGFLKLEVFRSVSRLRKLAPFDIIVCDPPSEQGNSFKAQRDWPKLARQLPSLLSPKGEMFLCLSSPWLPTSYLEELFQVTDVPLQLVATYQAGDDFPEKTVERGLNILHYRHI